LLHLVGSSILLYLIDDARSNRNQVYVQMSAVKNYEQKTLPLPVSQLKQYILRRVMFILFVQVNPVSWSIIGCLLDWGVGV